MKEAWSRGQSDHTPGPVAALARHSATQPRGAEGQVDQIGDVRAAWKSPRMDLGCVKTP